MLSRRQRSENLFRVQMMTSGDHDGVDARVVNDLGFIGGAIAKAELALGMLRVRSIGRANRDQLGMRRIFHRGNERTRGEHPGAKKSYTDLRCRGRPSGNRSRL